MWAETDDSCPLPQLYTSKRKLLFKTGLTYNLPHRVWFIDWFTSQGAVLVFQKVVTISCTHCLVSSRFQFFLWLIVYRFLFSFSLRLPKLKKVKYFTHLKMNLLLDLPCVSFNNKNTKVNRNVHYVYITLLENYKHQEKLGTSFYL